MKATFDVRLRDLIRSTGSHLGNQCRGAAQAIFGREQERRRQVSSGVAAGRSRVYKRSHYKPARLRPAGLFVNRRWGAFSPRKCSP